MLREDQTVWQCGTHEISLARPRVMGVLNVTPDSFSDGGKNLDHKTAVERGLDMLDQGADIIDVGGESTRPGFEPVDVDEEAKRVVPVVRDLVAAGAIVSVDTRHPEVARMCVRLGASIVNDVTAFTNPDMVNVAADTRCGCVVMHAGEVPGHANRRVV
ncbi:MAG: dihydropteroate synthase, partial [Atopobiaceae bacterium]